MNETLPEYLHMTKRAWKTRKRKEFAAVLRALEVYRLGCAFTPSYKQSQNLFTLADEIGRSLTVKAWGR